jgi:hypothetical protein
LVRTEIELVEIAVEKGVSTGASRLRLNEPKFILSACLGRQSKGSKLLEPNGEG